MNLRTPGPTPLPEPVKRALSRDMVDHRGPEFAAIMRESTRILQDLFRTQNDLLILTGSGTGGLEAAVVNLFSPGDRILVASIGNFGDRFASIAQAFGADVKKLSFGPGEIAEPSRIADALAQDDAIRAVLVTHNETSTGTTNPVREIAQVVKAAGRLMVVDAVSSIGSIRLDVDAWQLDVVITGSQKSWMIPPGLAMVALSPTAWEFQRQARMPRYYWDFAAAKKDFEKSGHTPWTPAVGLVFALNEAVKMIQAEGLDNVIARHQRVGDYVRGRLKQLGLGLLVKDDRFASNTVTAFRVPEGVEPKRVMARLREEHDVVIARGQGSLESSVLRIGHMGYVDLPDVREAVDALEQVLATEPQKAVASPEGRRQ